MGVDGQILPYGVHELNRESPNLSPVVGHRTPRDENQVVDEPIVSIQNLLRDHHGEVAVKANPVVVESVEGLHSLSRGKTGSASKIGENCRDDVGSHSVDLDLVPVCLQMTLSVDFKFGAYPRERPLV